MNEEFLRMLEGNLEHVKEFEGGFDGVQDSQEPPVVTVCCSDSRVLQDAMWSNGEPGRVFTCGNIGNRVVQETGGERTVSGDVLYPLVHTGTDVAVVVGHTGCGAVTATYLDVVEGIEEPAGIMNVVELLRSELEPGVETLPDGLDDDEAVNRLVEYNVDRQVDLLLESDDVPAGVDVVGVVYDFQDVYSGDRGKVHVVNVNGENDPDAVRSALPGAEDRVSRLWTP